ncbi:class I glutamine amidotransferase-like protein [Aspergillus filifer]
MAVIMETLKQQSKANNVGPKVLIVLTSADKDPKTGNEIGWFLLEFAHPWDVLQFKVEFVVASPKGGLAPLSAQSAEMYKDDPSSASFVGTVGASDAESISLIERFALAKKPIASVYHGPAVLLKPTLPFGEPLITSATVTGFSNLEEDALGTTAKMPFRLENEMH